MNRTTIAVAVVVIAAFAGFTISLWTTPSTGDATTSGVTTRPVPLEAPFVEPVAAEVAVAAVAEASPLPAPTRRFAFDHDLFATYLELERSDRGADLRTARDIVFACYLASRTDADIRTVAAGRVLRTTSEPLVPVQIEAARDLLSRCRGFEGMTLLELQQARADMGARLDRADDPVGWGEAIRRRRRLPSDDVLRAIVASQDAAAILDVAPILVDRWRRATGRLSARDDDAMERAFDAQVLMTLVSCDLGSDCTSDGFQMKQMCALSAHYCGLDQRAWIFEEFAPDDRRKLEERAAAMVDAIRNNDFSFWGL